MEKMIGTIQKYQLIAQQLTNINAYQELKHIEERISDRKFYLPIIGQFSAGKSHLINNILQEDLFPTRLTETTAFITFISYGPERQAYIEDKDGKFHMMDIELVKELTEQKITENPTYLAEFDINLDSAHDVEAIHVELPSDLLQNGLVLIDTPGLNSVVSRHEQLTMNLLYEAQGIIYVTGKSLTSTDQHFIRSLQGTGLEPIFVRTHLDHVNHLEGESVEEVMAGDSKVLQSIFPSPIHYFGVTNETELLKSRDWQVKMDKFTAHIRVEYAQKTRIKMEDFVASRIAFFKNQFLEELNAKKMSLDSYASLNDEEIQCRVVELEKNVKEMKERLKHKIIEQEQLIDDQKERNCSFTQKQFSKIAGQFSNEIQQFLSAEELRSQSIRIYQRFVEEGINHITLEIERDFQLLSKSVAVEVNESLEDIKGELSLSDSFDTKFEVEQPSVDEMMQEGSFIINQLKKEIANVEEDEKEGDYQQKKEELLKELKELKEKEAMYEQEKDNIGAYIPKYDEVKDSQFGEALKMVGQIGDLILLFTPTPAGKAGVAAKSVNTAAKVQKAAKMKKMASAGLHFVKQAGRLRAGMNPITTSEGDSSNDANPNDGSQSGEQSGSHSGGSSKTKSPLDDLKAEDIPPGVLDMLKFASLEYWFEKLGQGVDGPPLYQEDWESRDEYHIRRKAIEDKYERIRVKELQRFEELELIKNEEEKIKKEREIKEKQKKRMVDELQVEESHYREKMKKEAIRDYQQRLIAYVERENNVICERVLQKIEHLYEELNTTLPVSMAWRIQEKLNQYEQELKSVENSRLEQEDKYGKELKGITSLLEGLSVSHV